MELVIWNWSYGSIDRSIVIASEAELIVRTGISVYIITYSQADMAKVILPGIVVCFQCSRVKILQ